MLKKEFKTFALEASEESGKIISYYFNKKTLEVNEKDDKSPVTVADSETEQFLRQAIRERFPSHGIIGEEFGNENESADYVWILDPIDGTKSFIHGCVLFGTLIALTYRGSPILGIINQPILQQLCMGDGATTTLNGDAVCMRDCAALSNATLLTSDINMIEAHQNIAKFDSLRRATKLMRTWGDCYGYLLLATGKADIMIDPILNIWDIAALIPVIEGAGGKITSWDGGNAMTGSSCIAAQPRLHDQVLKELF